MGSRNHILDGGPHPRMRRGNFEGGKWCPIVKYRATLLSSVQKRLKRSRCRLGYWLRWAQGIVLNGGPDSLMERGNFGGKRRPL